MSEPTGIERGQVADLLAAITEVLDVPLAAESADDATATRVLRSRVAYVRGAMLSHLEGERDGLTSVTSAVRTSAVHYPVTYRPYESEPSAAAAADEPDTAGDREGEPAEQGHQLLDGAVLAVDPDPALVTPARAAAVLAELVAVLYQDPGDPVTRLLIPAEEHREPYFSVAHGRIRMSYITPLPAAAEVLSAAVMFLGGTDTVADSSQRDHERHELRTQFLGVPLVVAIDVPVEDEMALLRKHVAALQARVAGQGVTE